MPAVLLRFVLPRLFYLWVAKVTVTIVVVVTMGGATDTVDILIVAAKIGTVAPSYTGSTDYRPCSTSNEAVCQLVPRHWVAYLNSALRSV